MINTGGNVAGNGYTTAGDRRNGNDAADFSTTIPGIGADLYQAGKNGIRTVLIIQLDSNSEGD
jgi:hypothetical protein